MKNKVSFLSVLAIVLSTGSVYASDCVDEDCDITPNTPVIEVLDEDFVSTDFIEPNEQALQTIMFVEQIEQPLQPIVYEQTNISEYETCAYEQTCMHDYNCPFSTAAECAIWYKKPAYKTALMPRAPHLNDIRIDEMLYAIYSNYDIMANDEVMSPLLDRYKNLMRASRACCTEGIIYKMRKNGAKDSEIYQFLKDDANYFAVASRCMVMNDDEFQSSYSNGVTGKMAIEVRNACLCKNRQWFDTLLQPFFDVYQRAPMFEERPFVYTYVDDMQRDITVYINDEVHTTAGLLNVCPK